MTLRTLILPALLMLSACTEPLVTGDYLGEPLMTVEGRIYMDSGDPGTGNLRDVDLRVAVFWTQDVNGWSLDAGDVVEQQVVARASFPARYGITLYRPPDDSVLQPVPSGTGRLAVALLLLYWDEDGDARWDRRTEELAGGTRSFVLVYADGEVRSSLVGGRLSAGYHLMHLGSEDDVCLDGAGLALMQRATDAALIDLTVSSDLRGLMPDADCDGFVDVCEAILVESDQASPPAREALIEQWERCINDLYGEDPLLSCEQLFERERSGEHLDTHQLEYLATCRDDPSRDPIDPDLVCPGFLECQSAPNPGCESVDPVTYELCMDGPGLQVCAGEIGLDPGAPSTEQLTQLAECLWSLAPPPKPSDCLAEAYTVCATILEPYDSQDVPDQVWMEYELCFDEQSAPCGPPPEGACQQNIERAETCMDAPCFTTEIERLIECRNGVLEADDLHLCEWWLWMPQACHEEVCGEDAYERCLSELEPLVGPDDGRLQECEQICSEWLNDGQQDPDSPLGQDVQQCELDLGANFDC